MTYSSSPAKIARENAFLQPEAGVTVRHLRLKRSVPFNSRRQFTPEETLPPPNLTSTGRGLQSLRVGKKSPRVRDSRGRSPLSASKPWPLARIAKRTDAGSRGRRADGAAH